MTPISELLELLYVARMRPQTIRAKVSLSVDLGVANQAEDRWDVLNPKRQYRRLGEYTPEQGKLTRMYRLWYAVQSRAWRLEFDSDNKAKSLTSRDAGALGEQARYGWWPVKRVVKAGPMDPFVKLLVDPSPLLVATTLQVGDDLDYEGRTAAVVTAMPRRDIDLIELGLPYADYYDVMVDKEFGTLLSFAAVLDDVSYVQCRMLDVQFNVELESALFTTD